MVRVQNDFRYFVGVPRCCVALTILTRGIAVYLETLQYRLEESVSHRRTRQVTQLFTYLLTHNMFISCIRRHLMSADWVMPALSAVLLIFSFQFSLLFFNISLARPHQHCGVLLVFNTQYRTSNVAENLDKYLSCTERTFQEKDFELIWTVTMETRHLIKGPFGSEFPAICNHCGVMTAWSRNTWQFYKQFLRFFEKTIPYGKIVKILFRKFTWRQHVVQMS